MRRMIGLTLVALAAIPLSGCLGGRPIRYYTVDFPPASPPSAGRYAITLLVGHISAPEILREEPIVYRSGPNEIGTYEYHQWAEPPAQMVKIMLIRRLRASGQYQAVGELGSSVPGDFVLHGRLYDFEEVDSGGIQALVAMEFALVDRRTRKTVWTNFYSHREPVQGKQISGVVAALDRNLEQGLAGVLSGLQGYFAANLPAKP